MALRKGVYFHKVRGRLSLLGRKVYEPLHSFRNINLYTNEVTYPAYYTSILKMEGAYTSETSAALLHIQPMRTLTNLLYIKGYNTEDLNY
jgi:hypothetical protein